MTPKPKRGGKRPNAGRKRQTPDGTATRSVSLPKHAWRFVDHQRGELPTSAYFLGLVLKQDLQQ